MFIIDFFVENWPTIEKLLAAIGASGLLSTVISDNNRFKVIKFIMPIINIIGANVGKAKNDPSENF